jgi:hypothetical protein
MDDKNTGNNAYPSQKDSKSRHRESIIMVSPIETKSVLNPTLSTDTFGSMLSRGSAPGSPQTPLSPGFSINRLTAQFRLEYESTLREAFTQIELERRMELRRRRDQDGKWEERRKLNTNPPTQEEIERIRQDRALVDKMYDRREREVLEYVRSTFEAKLAYFQPDGVPLSVASGGVKAVIQKAEASQKVRSAVSFVRCSIRRLMNAVSVFFFFSLGESLGK